MTRSSITAKVDSTETYRQRMRRVGQAVGGVLLSLLMLGLIPASSDGLASE